MPLALSVEGAPLEGLAAFAWTCREAIGAPWRLVVHLRSSPAATATDLTRLVGRPARFDVTVDGGAPPRRFDGIVSDARIALGEDGAIWQVEVRPSAWRLDRTRGARVFHDDSVPTIVGALLKQAGVAVTLALQEEHGGREITIQYGEPGASFVHRLCEAEGISLCYESLPGGERAALFDVDFPELEGQSRITFRTDEGALVPGEAHVQALEQEEVAGTAGVHVRGYDFHEPTTRIAAAGPGGEAPAPTEHYEFRERFTSSKLAMREAKLVAERLACAHGRHLGRSTVLGFRPARRFTLAEAGPLDGAYLLVEVEHQGYDAAVAPAAQVRQPVYTNRFVAQPTAVPFRPARRAPRPRVDGVQPALVVGPPGEEIHTDAAGRVMLKFPWDRRAEGDDRIGCWARVAQASAGPGWGHLLLPRIGHEVVVAFEDGDPERSLVVRSAFNGQHPPPVPLPQERATGGLRSSSTPGGRGFGELLLDDPAGHERISLHAERDHVVEVGNDSRRDVGADEQVRIDRNRQTRILGNQALQVTEDNAVVTLHQGIAVGAGGQVRVGAMSATTVGGMRRRLVRLAALKVVGESVSCDVAKSAKTTIGGHARLGVAGAATVAAGGLTRNVGGSDGVDVAKENHELFGKTRSLFVHGLGVRHYSGGYALEAKNLKIAAQSLRHTSRAETSLEAKTFELQADELVVSVAGRKVLRMSKDGTVTLSGTKITVDVREIVMDAKEVRKETPGSVAAETRTEDEEEAEKGDGVFVLVTDVAAEEAKACRDVFILRSTDGLVVQRRIVRRDAEIVDGFAEVRFLELPKDASYTLVVRHQDGVEAVVFEDLPYAELDAPGDLEADEGPREIAVEEDAETGGMRTDG